MKEKDKINEINKTLSNNKSSKSNNNNNNNSNNKNNKNKNIQVDNISNATNYSTFNSKTKPLNQIGIVANKTNLYKSQEYYNNTDTHISNQIQNTEFLRIQNSIKQQKLLNQQQNIHNSNVISNTDTNNGLSQLNSSSLYLHNSNSNSGNNSNNQLNSGNNSINQLNSGNNSRSSSSNSFSRNRISQTTVVSNNIHIRNDSINENNLYNQPINQLNNQLIEVESKTDNNDKGSLVPCDSSSDLYYDHKANELSVVHDDVSNFSNFEKMLGTALLASTWQASNISSAVPLNNTNSMISGFQQDNQLQHNNSNSIRNSINDINHDGIQNKEVYIDTNSVKGLRNSYQNNINNISELPISNDNGIDSGEVDDGDSDNIYGSNNSNTSSIGLFASVMANINKK
jgi:hypothetical protein